MNYQRVYKFDLANGPGVRISLFVSGCNIRCPGCFNSEAWNFESGKKYTKKVRLAIEKYLEDDRYDGLSILGGEPFDQDKKGLKELIKLCKKAHSKGKNVWIWTGHYKEDLQDKWQKKLLKNCDVLVDGPFIEALKTLNAPFRGSSNQKIDFLKDF